MHAKLVWQSPTFPNLVLFHPNYRSKARARFDTDEEFLAWMITEHLPTVHPDYNPASIPSPIEEEDWPTDHTFVDAWEWSD